MFRLNFFLGERGCMGDPDKLFLFWSMRIVLKWNNDINKFGKKKQELSFALKFYQKMQ